MQLSLPTAVIGAVWTISLFGSSANCNFFPKRSPPHASQSHEFFLVCVTAKDRISSNSTGEVALLGLAYCTGFRFLSSTKGFSNSIGVFPVLRSSRVIVLDKRRKAGEVGVEEELLSLSESAILIVQYE